MPRSAAHVAEVPLRPLWRFMAGAAWRSLLLAWRHRPALVMAGSGLTGRWPG
jgi:phosphatidylinositol alpha-1,6-mannosyltransferase